MSRQARIAADHFEYLMIPDHAANDDMMVSPDLRLALELKMNAPDTATAAVMSRRLSIPDTTGGFAMRGKVAANMDTKRTKPEQDAIRDLEIDLIRTFANDIPANAELIAAIHAMITNAPEITHEFTGPMRDFIGQMYDFQSLAELASLPNAPDHIKQKIQELGASIDENMKTLGQMTHLPPAFIAQTQMLFSKTSRTFALPLLATLLPITADIPLSFKNKGTLQKAPTLHHQMHAVLAQVVASTGGKMTQAVTVANMALAQTSETVLPSRTAINAVIEAIQSVPLSAQSGLNLQMDRVQNTITEIRSNQLGVPTSTVRDMDNLANTLSRMRDVMATQSVMMSTGKDEKIAAVDRAVTALSENVGPITPAMIADIRQMAAILPEIVPTLMQPLVPTPGFVNTNNAPQIVTALTQIATRLDTATMQKSPIPPSHIENRLPSAHQIASPSAMPSSGHGPVIHDPRPPIHENRQIGGTVPAQTPPIPTTQADRPIIQGDKLFAVPRRPLNDPEQPKRFDPSFKPEPVRPSEAFKKVCPKTGGENCGCDTVENKAFKAVKELIKEKGPVTKTVDYQDALKKVKERVSSKFKKECDPKNCQDESHGHGAKAAATMGTTGDKLKAVTDDDFDDPFGSEPPPPPKKPNVQQNAPGVAA